MPDVDPHERTLSRRATLGLAAGVLGGLAMPSVSVADAWQARDLSEITPRILRTPFSEQNVAALIEALAQLGIAVYQRPGDLLAMIQPAPPRSPLKLLKSQVNAMALELVAGSGTPGREFDTALQVPEGVPPVSSLLAGYVAVGQTAGAEFSRALLGDQEWHQWADRFFPALVVDLFISDLAKESGSAPGAMKFMKLIQPSNICTAVQSFTSDVLEAVFGQLKIDVPKGDSNLLTDIWNWIIGAGEDVVQGLGDIITAPVIAAIQAIAGALAIGTSISSMLNVWTVTLDAEPEETRFGVDTEFITGRFLAGVDAGGATDWPDFLVDCAASMGISLPSLRGEGAPVTWKVSETPIDLIQEMGKSPLVEEQGKAELIYKTNNESSDVASGTPLNGLCITEVSVERSDVADLRDNLHSLLVANIPSPFDIAVQSVLGPAIASLTADLAQVMVKGYNFETLTVVYHEKQITVTPEPQEPEATCPAGTWYMAGFGAWFNGLMASAGGSPMTAVSEGGRLVLQLRGDGTYTVTSLEFEAVFTDGMYGYVASMSGTESGTYTAKDGTLSGIQTGGGLKLHVEAEGIFGTDLPFAVVGDTGAMEYECAGFSLILYPPVTGGGGVEWRPLDPDALGTS